MRVLQVSKLYTPWVGGIEKVVQCIAEGLKDEVHSEVLVCQARGWGRREMVNDVPINRTTSLGIAWGMPISPAYPGHLMRRGRQADILHFHTPFPLGVISCLLLGPRCRRIVVTYHSDIVRQRIFLRLYAPFLQRFLARADRIIVTSSALLESSPFLHPYKHKSVVIPLSIGVDDFARDPSRASDIEDWSSTRAILFVGRLSYYKGVEFLLEAMRDVDARLIIVGDGKRRHRLEALSHKLGVVQKVRFVGQLPSDELERYYARCDLLVLPSVERSEAFGIVQLEAMAHGKPVVNTDLPTGVPHVSLHGETGLTVPPRDAAALANAINTILNDAQLAARFSRNAEERVMKHFSREKMLQRVLDVYRELMP